MMHGQKNIKNTQNILIFIETVYLELHTDCNVRTWNCLYGLLIVEMAEIQQQKTFYTQERFLIIIIIIIINLVLIKDLMLHVSTSEVTNSITEHHHEPVKNRLYPRKYLI